MFFHRSKDCSNCSNESKGSKKSASRAPVRDCKAIQELGTSRRLQARAIAASNLLRAFALPYGNSWYTRTNRFGGAGAGFTVLFSCPEEMETYPSESKMIAANPRITVMRHPSKIENAHGVPGHCAKNSRPARRCAPGNNIRTGCAS